MWCWMLASGGEGVTDPAPLPASDLLVDWLLSRPLPQLYVADLLWPSDVKDASKTHVDEGLDLLQGGFCHSLTPRCF